ncbi:two-component system response regulator [Campylobacter blaseri]|uniref:Two-component system response regulator n=1 Tax=Campylobacter blaseri TaxID=2042961 RepID=A0A2P8R3P1_9BACT|nr:response regulator [Campylobacter blaseri]PSM53116.1 two-component system response regulator [Campylobacter blaseri]PSM54582.1 two-component system response regulator [Campylobacter blaseri]QKF86945.1 two-component system response regulator [Campylobacter blaseri]
MSESINSLKKLSILIVEDDEISRDLLVEGLKPYCNSIYGAKNGLDGLEKFNKYKIDIIITDIHMPNMNGFEMMKEISNIKPHQKFIVLTSYDSDLNLMKSIEQGAILFLKKPIDIKELRSMLITLTYEKDEKLTKISDSISINIKKEKIYKDGEEIYLTYLQNKIFWLFAYNLNQLVSYDMIEEFVYENEYASKGAIQNVILRLRRELGIQIKNIPELGYILAAKKME